MVGNAAGGHDVGHPSKGSSMRLLPLFAATVCCSFAVLAAEPPAVAPARIALHAAHLAGDPLSDVSSVLKHVGFVMKGGQVVRGPAQP